LYVITTAKKRDSKDWEDDAKVLGIKIEVVDSWNNIKNYMHLKTVSLFLMNNELSDILHGVNLLLLFVGKTNGFY
jgi:hypothetical protein